MGCLVSKEPPIQELTVDETKLDSLSAYDTPKQASRSRSGSHASTAPAKTPTVSRAASAGGAELRPEQQIAWKLHVETAPSMGKTFDEIESLKDATCVDLGVPKNKVGLCGPERFWLKNARGGWSPATPVVGSTAEEMYAAFQASDDKMPLVQVIPDMRLHPTLKTNPAVVNRPHLVFTASAMMVTRTGSGKGHAIGMMSLWDTVTVAPFTPEREARLAEAAAAVCATLQRPLFEALGLDPTEAATGPNPPELPAVWVNVADCNWPVLGINSAWEKLTGVGLDVLEDFPGLRSVLVSSDGRDASVIRHIEENLMASMPAGATLPLILSPCAPAAGMLQYIMALRRPDGPPPLPSSESFSASTAADIWMLECHAFMRAEDYIGCSSPSEVRGDPPRSGSRGAGSGSSVSTPQEPHRVGSALVSLTPPLIPPRFANLQLGPILGSGSYANVFAGRLGDRPVAVKIMRRAYGPDARTDDWLAHYEAFSNIDISHDNVIATLDWARLEDVGGWAVWIIQELAEKGSLSAAITSGVLREGGVSGAPADIRAVLATAREIARGMRYLHSVNEIHSDLSSNNVMLVAADNARGFEAKVSDFGLTRREGAQSLTQTVGTVTHMAPEMLVEGKTSKSSDVFSFGVILYEMWTGKRAWAGMGTHQVIFAVSCRGERIEMPSDAPEDYAKLATECMAPEMKDRPTFNEIVPRIDAMLSALGPLPSTSPVRISSSSKGRPILSDD